MAQKRYFIRPTNDWYSAAAATTTNVTTSTALVTGQVLDGYTLLVGDKVLVKDQTTATQNGLYVVGAVPARDTTYGTLGSLTDAADAAGTVVKVANGTANAGKSFLQYNEPALPGTDALLYIKHPSPGKKSV